VVERIQTLGLRCAPAFLLIALILAAPIAAQTAAKCYDCKGTGLIPCPGKECKTEKICGTKIPHKCDAIYGAECCRGIGKILCPKCKDPIVETELKTELEARKAWVDQMRKVDQGTQMRFAHVETDHWIFHCSLPAWKVKVNVDEVTLNRVRSAHLWAERLEDTAVFVQKVLGKFPGAKQTANIVNNGEEMMRVTLTTQGVGKNRPFKTFSPNGIFTTGPHDEFINDENLHPHVVHTATHILMHATHASPSEFMNSWFHEAFAHWVEYEKFKQQRTFCWQEVANQKDPWILADGKKNVYSEVGSKKDEPLAMIMTKDIDRSKARDRAYGWAFVEFMIKTRKPEEFRKFHETLKETNGDTKKALNAAYGWSTASFQEKWREWVLKNWAP
jgi:hypothetical protein